MKIAAYLTCMILFTSFGTAGPAGIAFSSEQAGFHVVSGEWLRTDGDYTLRVSFAKEDGSVNTAYFNPGKIHVKESRIGTKGGLVRLFVKLMDKGYPGSTYTLYYYAAKDALAGFYYQAALDQTYEVIFLRK